MAPNQIFLSCYKSAPTQTGFGAFLDQEEAAPVAGEEIEIPSFDSICEVIEMGANTQNPEEIVAAVNSLKVLIMHGERFNQDRFVSSVVPMLRVLVSVQEQPDMAAQIMQLFEAIQGCNCPFTPMFISEDFLAFCWDTARRSSPDVAVHAFGCIYNIVRSSSEWRDLVLGKFPVGLLESEIICKPEVCAGFKDVRRCAMELVHDYAQFPLAPEIGAEIVTLCKKCLESHYEELFAPSLRALVRILDTCPDVTDMLKRDPLPDLVDTITYGMDKDQLMPSIVLLKFYFMSGMTLPEKSWVNFITLLGHTDAEISTLTYKSLKSLMRVNPGLIDRMNFDYLMDELDQVIHKSASRVKVRVGKFVCWAVNYSVNLAEALIKSEKLDIFLELLQFEDLPDLQLKAMNLLIQMIQKFNSEYRVCEQLHTLGIEAVMQMMESEWATEDLSKASSVLLEVYQQGLRWSPPPDPSRRPAQRRRHPRRVVRRQPEPIEEETELPPVRPRPRLWVK